MIHITDMPARALGRMVERWKNDPALSAIIRLIADQWQAIEDAAYQVATLRNIDTAFGQQLDNLGKLVGQARSGMSDDAYRLRIKARLLINRSSGTAPELIAIFALLVSSATIIAIRGEFPAMVVANLSGDAVANAPELSAILQTAKAGGVRAVLESTPAIEDAMFTWNSSASGQRWNEGVWGSAIGDD